MQPEISFFLEVKEIADDGTFLSVGTYDATFLTHWEYVIGGLSHTLRRDNAAASSTDEQVFPDSFNPIPTDWANFTVGASILGSNTSAFSFIDYHGKRYYTSYNLLDIIDVYFTVTIPSPGISFSSTHGSGGGDGIGGASLAI